MLVNQNLYFHLEELACVMQARGACKLLPSRGARKFFPSRGACDSLQFLGDIICTSQKHHVINNETFGSEIGLHFRFKAPLIIQTNYRSGGLLFWRFRHKIDTKSPNEVPVQKKNPIKSSSNIVIPRQHAHIQHRRFRLASSVTRQNQNLSCSE